MAARHWKSFPDPSGRPPTGRVRLRTRRLSGPSVRHPRDQASGQAGPLGGSLAAASRGKQVSDMDRLPAMRLPDCRERGSAGSDGLAGAVSGCEGAHTKATAEPAWNASPVPDLLSVGAGASALRGSRARALPCRRGTARRNQRNVGSWLLWLCSTNSVPTRWRHPNEVVGGGCVSRPARGIIDADP